jgi:hypothetical protein
MTQLQGDGRPGVLVDRMMLHDLVNHLTIALGHSDLLLLEKASQDPDRGALEEIRGACRAAIALVERWRERLPPRDAPAAAPRC